MAEFLSLSSPAYCYKASEREREDYKFTLEGPWKGGNYHPDRSFFLTQQQHQPRWADSHGRPVNSLFSFKHFIYVYTHEVFFFVIFLI